MRTYYVTRDYKVPVLNLAFSDKEEREEMYRFFEILESCGIDYVVGDLDDQGQVVMIVSGCFNEDELPEYKARLLADYEAFAD